MPRDKVIYQGTLKGIVSSKQMLVAEYRIIFLLKLEEKIEGIPEEIPVLSQIVGMKRFLYIEEGDRVIVHGKFVQRPTFWKDDHFGMNADHIYNFTRKCGL